MTRRMTHFSEQPRQLKFQQIFRHRSSQNSVPQTMCRYTQAMLLRPLTYGSKVLIDRVVFTLLLDNTTSLHTRYQLPLLHKET